MDTIIAAAITGVLALIGVVITSIMGNRKIERKLEIHQAVTDEKIEALTKAVQKHNDFATRMPALEQKVDGINEKIHIYHSN